MKFRNIILIVLVLVVFSILGFTIGWAKDGQQCTMNPLLYGADRIYQQNDNLEVSCTCNLLEMGYEPIHFNRTTIWQNTKSFSSKFINVSNLKIG